MKVARKYRNITFNMITPEYFGRVQLAAIALKSYMLAKNFPIQVKINSFFSETDPKEIAQEIYAQKPDIAAFSLYVWTEKVIQDVCRLLKKLDRDILILIGGNVPTFQGKYLIEKYRYFDIAICGQGEESCYLLLEHLRQGKQDISDIPNLVYRDGQHLIETLREENFRVEDAHYPICLEDVHDEEVLFYETSRGCIYRCKYCAYNMNWGGKSTMHLYPWEKVENDLKNIFRLPRIKKLDFVDSTIIGKRERGLKILRLLNHLNDERCKIGKKAIEIGVDVSLEDFDDEVLREIKRMYTFAYGFGLQSIDNEVLRLASRRFQREKFTHYFHLLTQKSGAAINLELMFGLPGDTYQKFCDALEYTISELNAHFVVCFRFAVLPGSQFWKEKKQYQIISEDHPPYYVLSTPTFPTEDLEKAELLAFYFQLVYTLFRGVKRMIDNHCRGQKIAAYDKIVEMFLEKYSHFFDNENLRQGDVYRYVIKLGQPECKEQKKAIVADLRKTIKKHIELVT